MAPFNSAPCRPVGRGAPLVRPSPVFQKRPVEQAAAAGGSNAKGQLNELLAKILGRPLTKEDMTYEIESGPGGFCASLVVPGMSNQAFTGSTCSKRKEAEQSAASVALAALQASAPGQMQLKASTGKAKVKS